jgi:hypothetical protein
MLHKVHQKYIMHFMQLAIRSYGGSMSTKDTEANATANRARTQGRGPRRGSQTKLRVKKTGSSPVKLNKSATGRREKHQRVVAQGSNNLASNVREIFIRRTHAWARSLADIVPTEVLAEALERPSARGSILHVLSTVPADAEKSEAEALRERALERAVLVREQLREEAGGFHPTSWVAEHLGVTRQSVDRYRKEGTLLAVEAPQGHRFPACQFTADGIVPGLKDVLATMHEGSFWETLAGLVTPSPLLGGKSVIEALQTAQAPKERAQITEVARAYSEE